MVILFFIKILRSATKQNLFTYTASSKHNVKKLTAHSSLHTHTHTCLSTLRIVYLAEL